MKKDEVYRLIEYNGVYDDKVKKNLRKLIKKNHPDHKGDAKILKVLFEVKKELETNKVSYSFKEDKPVIKDDINYNYLEQLKKFQKQRIQKEKELNILYQNLSNIFKKYSSYYEEYCQLQNDFCNQYDELKQTKKINKQQLISYLALLLVISLYICFPKIYILVILIVLVVYLLYFTYQKHLQIKQKKLLVDKFYIKQKSFDKKINEMRSSIDKENKVINMLNNDLTKINNNIRYYESKMKKKY